MQCAACGNELAESNPAASISGSLSGDECTECYFPCPRCGAYTVGVYWDCFSGEETSSFRGPVAPEEGRRQIELIRRCETPWNKKCRCDAHRAYFDDMLD